MNDDVPKGTAGLVRGLVRGVWPVAPDLPSLTTAAAHVVARHRGQETRGTGRPAALRARVVGTTCSHRSRVSRRRVGQGYWF